MAKPFIYFIQCHTRARGIQRAHELFQNDMVITPSRIVMANELRHDRSDVLIGEIVPRRHPNATMMVYLDNGDDNAEPEFDDESSEDNENTEDDESSEEF